MNGSSSSIVASPIANRVVAVGDLDLVRVEAPERDVVAYEVRLELVRACRDDRRAAWRKRRDRLRVRLRDALDGAEELEVLRPDVRNDDDRGRAIAQSAAI